jgi:hypothetical protein
MEYYAQLLLNGIIAVSIYVNFRDIGLWIGVFQHLQSFNRGYSLPLIVAEILTHLPVQYSITTTNTAFLRTIAEMARCYDSRTVPSLLCRLRTDKGNQ